MAAPPIPPHIPTTDEIEAYLIEKIAADGTCVVFNGSAGQTHGVPPRDSLGLEPTDGRGGRSRIVLRLRRLLAKEEQRPWQAS
jgi:hypothetical protein